MVKTTFTKYLLEIIFYSVNLIIYIKLATVGKPFIVLCFIVESSTFFQFQAMHYFLQWFSIFIFSLEILWKMYWEIYLWQEKVKMWWLVELVWDSVEHLVFSFRKLVPLTKRLIGSDLRNSRRTLLALGWGSWWTI